MIETIKSEKSKLMGILSMVFGIVAVLFSFNPFGRGFTILLSLAAIILGVIELDRACRGLSDKSAKNMAIAGIVLGGVSILLFIAMAIAWKAFAFHKFDRGIVEKWNLSAFGRFRHLR